MAVRRKEVRSIVILYPRGNYFGDQETDDLQKAIMDEAAGGNTRMILNMSDVQSLNRSASASDARLQHYARAERSSCAGSESASAICSR